jgi:hypothetical protein
MRRVSVKVLAAITVLLAFLTEIPAAEAQSNIVRRG